MTRNPKAVARNRSALSDRRVLEKEVAIKASGVTRLKLKSESDANTIPFVVQLLNLKFVSRMVIPTIEFAKNKSKTFGVLRLWRSFGSLLHYPLLSMKLVTHKATSCSGLIQFSPKQHLGKKDYQSYARAVALQGLH